MTKTNATTNIILLPHQLLFIRQKVKVGDQYQTLLLHDECEQNRYMTVKLASP